MFDYKLKRTEIVNKVLSIAGPGPNDDENNNKEVFPTRVKCS